MISFEYPIVLLIPIIIYICQKYCKKEQEVVYLVNARYYATSQKKKIDILNILKWVTVIAISISLASPYTKEKNPDSKYGINILMALDMSGSMEEIFEDVQSAVLKFTQERNKDNVGLILFAEKMMVASPMTTNTKYLEKIVSSLKLGLISSGGTAINDTLITANKILEKQEGITKIIVIFSDGEDTTSQYRQEEVDKVFATNPYRVYSLVYGPQNDFLYTLSSSTHGQYFEVLDVDKLADVYSNISEIEKELIDSDVMMLKNSQAIYFSWIGFISLFFYILLRYKVLQK